MGFLAGLFGGGGNQGVNFQAQRANIANYTDPSQASAALAQANQGLAGQQGSLAQQQAFVNALQGQNGLGNQANVFAQQQALANQLQGVANGTGPNPALAQFNQATGQNVANQAALMAGQRGAGQNAGLIARQAAQQGAGIQQQAAGQSAALQAQQQLNAMGQLQGQQGMMGNLAAQQVGQQQQGLGQLANQATGYSQAAQNLQGNILNAGAQGNSANVNMQGNMNDANSRLQSGNAQNQSSGLFGLIGGAASALSGGLLANGGMVGHYADGGMPSLGVNTDLGKPMSFAGNHFLGDNWSSSKPGNQPQSQPIQSMQLSGPGAVFQGAEQLGKSLGNIGKAGVGALFGDSAPASVPMASSGPSLGVDTNFGPAPTMSSIMGAAKGGMANMKEGGKVKGQAKVKGDSYSNDTIPAMLSPKEIVIPRSITMSANAPEMAAKFVAAILAKQGLKK